MSIVLIPRWRLMGSAGAIPGLSCGFAGGVVALTAMGGRKERAITVIAGLVPFLFAVVFVLAELIIDHSRPARAPARQARGTAWQLVSPDSGARPDAVL